MSDPLFGLQQRGTNFNLLIFALLLISRNSSFLSWSFYPCFLCLLIINIFPKSIETKLNDQQRQRQNKAADQVFFTLCLFLSFFLSLALSFYIYIQRDRQVQIYINPHKHKACIPFFLTVLSKLGWAFAQEIPKVATLFISLP